MIVFKDKTFCASPNCKNDCGRKMTREEHAELQRLSPDDWMPVSSGHFCGEPTTGNGIGSNND